MYVTMVIPVSHYVKISVSGEELEVIALNSAREALAIFDREIFKVSNLAKYPFGITQVDVYAVLEKEDMRLKETWVKRNYL